MKLLLTCEHGGHSIPKKYQSRFTDHETVLKTHRGYDLGAHDIFKHLQPLFDDAKSNMMTRLLIDYNRSLHHRNLFSEFTKTLSADEKQNLINHCYLPYRMAIEKTIKNHIEQGETVLHLSIHSFTPTLNNIERHCDIGLLYDSSNNNEKEFCKQLKIEINKLKPHLNVRFNYPYSGKADGFTTYLRKCFPNHYLGIELEINQKFSNSNQIEPTIKNTLWIALKQCSEQPICS